VLAPMVAGAVLVTAFVIWETKTPEPMLPLRLFRSRGFTMANVASMLMYFGMFGSIFLLAQFLQVVQHYSPLEAGLRTLPWTAMPIVITPIAGALSDRIGGRPLLVAGLALQAIGLGWMALVASPTVPYLTLVPAFVISGVGMSLFFGPAANVVLGSVRRDQEGIASGANNAIRELGGVFGIAVLGAIFSAHGGYASGTSFVAGLTPAVWGGAAGVAVATVAAILLPRARRAAARTAAPAREFELVG
jgi:predicted MFS family arabinose efflux permease